MATKPVYTKNQLLRQYSFLSLGILLFSLIVFGLPLGLLDSKYAIGFALGIPPQIFVSLSWALGAWYGWEKGWSTLRLLTIGMSPLRLAVELGWFYMIFNIFEEGVGIAVGSAMIHYVLFSIPMVVMITNLMKGKPNETD